MFFLLYKSTDDGVFDDFPKTSDHFPKISENFPKLFWRPDERSRTFSENFRKFPKVSEDFRRLPKTFGEDPKMFRLYTNEFKYNLREKLDVSKIIDIFTCEDIISSHVRISYRFYQFLTTRYTTDFYIINRFISKYNKLIISFPCICCLSSLVTMQLLGIAFILYLLELLLLLYKITKIVRTLWLAERRVCMRVCKHGCHVTLSGFPGTI